MDYKITITQVNEELFNISVSITETETEILAGETSVCCETEEQAIEYAETVFLPDLKANFKKLKTLKLASEIPAEVVVNDTPIDIEG